MSFLTQHCLRGYRSRHCERLQGAWQSSKNNKNLNISIFNWIASSILRISSQ
ncbi:hypothetical protein RMAECT_0368 [Rickettsia rhipicephali str. Ect]|uniref:Uncharacterized protein n=1 Tax=Rickettsia rhipicephali str. Ect TaxID=1359199 RepID=A0A0F3PCV5_RICRH|nr:hypothetical protein RMAECT_0368 [Rickettsia rhipicephali str. Ect]